MQILYGLIEGSDWINAVDTNRDFTVVTVLLRSKFNDLRGGGRRVQDIRRTDMALSS